MKNTQNLMKFVAYGGVILAFALVYFVTGGDLIKSTMAFLIASLGVLAHEFEKTTYKLQNSEQSRTHYRNLVLKYEDKYKDTVYADLATK